MLLYPMKRYSTGWNKTEGVICVKSSVKELKDRMEKIAGEINGSITVTFQDTCLLSEENETNQEDTITMTSRTERMKVNLCVDTDLFLIGKMYLQMMIWSYQKYVKESGTRMSLILSKFSRTIPA